MAMTIPADDFEFQDDAIAKVSGDRERGWFVTKEDGWSIGIDGDSPVEPAPGMPIRLYGRGIGAEVRGIVLDGNVVRYQSPADYAAFCAERSRQYEAEHAAAQLEPMLPVPQIAGFEWTEDMRQISGFGGGYERACRQMVSQGCRWWSEHPDADPQFHGFKGVYGVIVDDNDDAKALETAIMAGIDGASGAMHQAAVSHTFSWRRVGSWLAYQARMRELKREENAE